MYASISFFMVQVFLARALSIFSLFIFFPGGAAAAIRMRGVDGVKGECKVGSLFHIWLGDLPDNKNYSFSLVFGKVVEGLDELIEASRIPKTFSFTKTVTIVKCGTYRTY